VDVQCTGGYLKALTNAKIVNTIELGSGFKMYAKLFTYHPDFKSFEESIIRKVQLKKLHGS
jgi:hypothetical protein